jgi:ubiquinone/menaquinone biosynthesis C-methylase UbiE
MNMIFRDKWFDLVVSFDSFEHIPDPRRALNEMIRVCKPGGCVFVKFDPIWTADTGSHFFHRVSEPWAHLLLDPQQYIARMKAAGAEPWELQEFSHAMNRWRLADFEQLFDDAERRHGLKRISSETWSGVEQPEFLQHSNFSTLVDSSEYTVEELMIRGMRYVWRVPE